MIKDINRRDFMRGAAISSGSALLLGQKIAPGPRCLLY